MVGHDAPNAHTKAVQALVDEILHLQAAPTPLERKQLDDERLIGYLVTEVNRLHREINGLLERLVDLYKVIDGEPREG